eukprot:7390889-Prymnesium_polylepis.1
MLSVRPQASADSAAKEGTSTGLVARSSDSTMTESAALNEDTAHPSPVRETTFDSAAPRPRPSPMCGRSEVPRELLGDVRGELTPSRLFGDLRLAKRWPWLELLTLALPLVVLTALLRSLQQAIGATCASARRRSMLRSGESGREGEESIAAKLGEKGCKSKKKAAKLKKKSAAAEKTAD